MTEAQTMLELAERGQQLKHKLSLPTEVMGWINEATTALRATAAAQPVAWRCFFCDDVFTSQREAALHFGAFDSCEPDVTACKLMSHQQHVLEYIRGLEEEVGLYQAENHPTIKAVFAIEDEMRRAVKRAEEEGYNRGVADMKEQGFCAEPAKHDPPPTPAGDTEAKEILSALINTLADPCDASDFDDSEGKALRATIKDALSICKELSSAIATIPADTQMLELAAYLDSLEQELIGMDADMRLPDGFVSPGIWADRLRAALAATGHRAEDNS